MNKNNEIKSIYKEIKEKDSYERADLSKLIDTIDKVEDDDTNEDLSKIKVMANKLKKIGFTGPETNGEVIVKDLFDAILQLF